MNGEQFKARPGPDSGKGADEVRRDAGAEGARPKSKSAATKPPLTGEAKDKIGYELRRAYDDLLAEPMPDRFAKLLDELARSEGSE